MRFQSFGKDELVLKILAGTDRTGECWIWRGSAVCSTCQNEYHKAWRQRRAARTNVA